MPTSSLLLPSYRWSSIQKGEWFQVGERLSWDITLTIARITPGGSFSVLIEVLPEGGTEDDWATLYDFGVQTTVETITKTSRATPGPADFTISPTKDIWIRARIAAIVGTVIADVRGVAPFFDESNEDHMNLLEKETRNWVDGIEELVTRSEEDVVNTIIADPYTGDLDIDFLRPGAPAAVLHTVARQIEHNKRKTVLERTADPSSLVTLRGMGQLAPGTSQRLRQYRCSGKGVWLGR